MYYHILPEILEYLKLQLCQVAGLSEEDFQGGETGGQYHLKYVAHNIRPDIFESFSKNPHMLDEQAEFLCFIGSSDALTLNTLGGRRCVMERPCGKIDPGRYMVTYWPRMPILDSKNAYLVPHAVLQSEDRQLLCLWHTDFMDWLTMPQAALKEDFLAPELYHDPEISQLFHFGYELLLSDMTENQKEYEYAFHWFDAYQLLHHFLAAYNYVSWYNGCARFARQPFIRKCVLHKSLWLAVCPEIYGSYVGRVLIDQRSLLKEAAIAKERLGPFLDRLREITGVQYTWQIISWKDCLSCVETEPCERKWMTRYEI